MKLTKTNLIWISVLTIVAVLSFFMISPIATSVETHATSLAYLDTKVSDVLALTASATSLSAILAAVPGDATTSIANMLINLDIYFLIILCGIYFEKYLLTLSGYITFRWLIPLACGLGIFAQISQKRNWSLIGKRIAAFGLILVLLVPISVKISQIIENTHTYSVQETIDRAQNVADFTEDNYSEMQKEENKNALGIIGNWVNNGVNTIIHGISGIVTDILHKAEEVTSHFMETIAIMIITSCVIPILVFLCFITAIKLLFHANIDTANLVHTVPKIEWKQKQVETKQFDVKND